MSGILQLINTFPSGGFAVKNSLRFRSSASAYLNRTPASASNRTTWTFSAWIKRGTLGVHQFFFLGKTADNGNSGTVVTGLSFTSSDNLEIYSYTYGTGVVIDLITTQVFRDPSAWYHIEVAIDTTQATANNRAILYVNGVQVTSFSTATYPTQNSFLGVNAAFAQRIGLYVDSAGSGSLYFDGYIAEINFIDGQALTPSSFGAFDATSGVWQPVKYSGTYGTNGFYLKFSDTTSTTTLCYDYSGNGNNWTPNNISLTAGSTYDSMLDSPTNYDNGGNGVGNYAVLNPLKNYGGTISEANQTVVFPASGNVYQTQNTIAMSSGAWYWEVYITSAVSGVLIGILNTSSSGTESFTSANFWGYYTGTGYKYHLSGSSYGASATAGDVIGVAFDGTNGTLTFYKNGVSQGVAFTGLTGLTVNASVNHDGSGGYGSTTSHNFGQRPFAFSPPSGYKSLCTQNMPTPTIQNGANYMAATLWTGNGTSQNIANTVNGINFQPDFVWLKSRSSASWSNILQDTVRGITEYLVSNSTGAAGTTSPNIVNAVTSSGFQLLSNGNSNNNGDTYVGWQWKAGGTAVTNNAGSITSQVSANTTAGFSVVTYTGNGTSGATVGHGLGVAPAFIIIKDRTAARTGDQWPTYHVSTGASGGIVYLNSTAAGIAASSVWNNTNPTSSVFTLGNWGGINYSGDAFVAYCFAAIPGYSAFGSYTGNGSSDGPFVFLGFRPRFIMVKCSSTSSGSTDWWMFDTSRLGYNVHNANLSANTSAIEYDDLRLDVLSNGFKLRVSYTNINASGETFIYAAFAENPFKYSLAR